MNSPVDALPETSFLPAVAGDGDQPDTEPVSPAVARPCNRMADYVRHHPGGSLLLAVGLGCATVLVARVLTPAPTPRNRAVRLLEDIRHRLSDLGQPAYDRISDLAEGGAHAVGKGVDRLGALHLDRKLHKLGRGFMNLFH